MHVFVTGATGWIGSAVVEDLLAAEGAKIVQATLDDLDTLRSVAPSATKHTSFYKVPSVVLWPGMGLALSSVGFGLITAFIALLFAAQQWPTLRWHSPRSVWLSLARAFSSGICQTSWVARGWHW